MQVEESIKVQEAQEHPISQMSMVQLVIKYCNDFEDTYCVPEKDLEKHNSFMKHHGPYISYKLGISGDLLENENTPLLAVISLAYNVYIASCKNSGRVQKEPGWVLDLIDFVEDEDESTTTEIATEVAPTTNKQK